MYKISCKSLFLSAFAGSLLVLSGCTEVVIPGVVYSEDIVTPVQPYTVVSDTTYASTMIPTRYYNNQTCVSRSYYLNDQLCPRTFRHYNYRACAPQRYSCWSAVY